MSAIRAIQEAFDMLAARYESHAALEQEIGRRLLERCMFQQYAPRRIVDLGCGTGATVAELQREYPQADVIGIDLSPAMLARLRARSDHVRAVCADMLMLPVASASVDLLFSNMAMQFVPDLAALFNEFRRVLRPRGMLLFSLPDIGSLAELRKACRALGGGVGPTPYRDMLDIGDALVATGFSEPVMDSDRVKLHFPDLDALLGEMEATGVALLIDGWGRIAGNGQVLREGFAPLLEAGRYPLSFEIAYGAAFGPPEGQPRRTAEGEVATFSVDSLLKSRPMS